MITLVLRLLILFKATSFKSDPTGPLVISFLRQSYLASITNTAFAISPPLVLFRIECTVTTFMLKCDYYKANKAS